MFDSGSPSATLSPRSTPVEERDRDLDEAQWMEGIIRVCESAARGDFESRILHIDRRSARGRLALAINDLLDRADAFIREATATLDHASRGKFYRRVLPNGMVGAYRTAAEIINQATEAMAAKSRALAELESRRRVLADEFQQNVGGVISTLSQSADVSHSTAQQLSDLASNTTQAAEEGLSAIQSATENMRQVGEVSQTLTESEAIVQNTLAQSRQVAESALEDAIQMVSLMKELDKANQSIGEIISLIATIAKQTHMLSLNATIEAARAGEAGRGFAVVANEVKKLANETAGATTRITAEVRAVQDASQNTASAMVAVDGKIRQLNDLAGDIDDAINKQMEITENINRWLQQTDECVGKASSSIAQTGSAAERTADAVNDLLVCARRVTDQSDALNNSVSLFLQHVRGDNE